VLVTIVEAEMDLMESKKAKKKKKNRLKSGKSLQEVTIL